MGGCCAGEDDHHTSTMGSRGKAKGAGASNEPIIAYEQKAAPANMRILDSINDTVRQQYN